jgi:hypothetical protein
MRLFKPNQFVSRNAVVAIVLVILIQLKFGDVAEAQQPAPIAGISRQLSAAARAVLLDPDDTVVLLLDHQTGLFQTVKDVPRPIMQLQMALSEVPTYDRTSINSWEDVEFVKAVKATSRKKLVMMALWTEACLPFQRLMRSARATKYTLWSTPWAVRRYKLMRQHCDASSKPAGR